MHMYANLREKRGHNSLYLICTRVHKHTTHINDPTSFFGNLSLTKNILNSCHSIVAYISIRFYYYLLQFLHYHDFLIFFKYCYVI